jgi:nitrite reductase/ring-hydroxylating ferredoxin subunit/uncharacterized membrane protein
MSASEARPGTSGTSDVGGEVARSGSAGPPPRPAERAVHLVERQEWLEPIAEAMDRTVRGAYAAAGPAGQQVADLLHGTWLGHPLHPALVAVPIGAWTCTAVLDGVEATSGSQAAAAAADASLKIGLAGAAVAALAGLTDWQHTDGKARRVGVMHAVLNTVATGFYVGSWVARRRGSRSAGRGLASIAFAVANASAFFGGHLVYNERVGVNHAIAPLEPREFVPVLAESELPEGTPRRAEWQGQRIVLVREGSAVYALVETCAHLGGPLAEGSLEDGCIRCPWHGSRFRVADGQVVNGPATMPQPRYETRVREGQIEVRALGA